MSLLISSVPALMMMGTAASSYVEQGIDQSFQTHRQPSFELPSMSNLSPRTITSIDVAQDTKTTSMEEVSFPVHAVDSSAAQTVPCIKYQQQPQQKAFNANIFASTSTTQQQQLMNPTCPLRSQRSSFELSTKSSVAAAAAAHMRAQSRSLCSIDSIQPTPSFIPSSHQVDKQATNTSTSTSTSTNSEGTDISSFLTAIASSRYLFFETKGMHIQHLEASADDLYTVYTFLVPNQPLVHTHNGSSQEAQAHSRTTTVAATGATTSTEFSSLKQASSNYPSLIDIIAKPTLVQQSHQQPPSSSVGRTATEEAEKRKRQSSIGGSTPIGFRSSSTLGSFTQLSGQNGGTGSGQVANGGPGLSESSISSLLSLSYKQFAQSQSQVGRNSACSIQVPSFTTLPTMASATTTATTVMNSSEKMTANSSSSSSKKAGTANANPEAHQLEEEMAVEEEDSAKANVEEMSDEEDSVAAVADSDDSDEEAKLIREIKAMQQMKMEHGKLIFDGTNGTDFFDFCEGGSGGKRRRHESLNGGGSGHHKNKFDTKNLVKNFLNSFISFVHHPDEETPIVDTLGLEGEQIQPSLSEFRTQLRNFFKGKKFNRVLLKEFIFEDVFRPLFLFFLENRALNWIEAGRMKDKASHLRALKNFIFVCQNYDQIKSWRFRYNFVGS